MDAIVADCLSRRIDPAAQHRIGDDASLPYGLENLVSADYAIAVDNQEVQQIENLRLDRTNEFSAAQFAPCDVKNAVFKSIDQWPPHNLPLRPANSERNQL